MIEFIETTAKDFENIEVLSVVEEEEETEKKDEAKLGRMESKKKLEEGKQTP